MENDVTSKANSTDGSDKMPFFVEIRVKPNCDDIPKLTQDQHLGYLDANIHLVLAAGALLDDAGLVRRGGFYILDVEEREQAEAFVAQDPFIESGLIDITQVTRWRKAYFDHKRLI